MQLVKLVKLASETSQKRNAVATLAIKYSAYRPFDAFASERFIHVNASTT